MVNPRGIAGNAEEEEEEDPPPALESQGLNSFLFPAFVLFFSACHCSFYLLAF